MDKKDYLALTGEALETVQKWLHLKMLADPSIEIGDTMTYEQQINLYLSDSKKDWYVVRTRGKITASKCKQFIKNPEEYWIRYELELPEIDEEQKQCFKIGTAFDCMVSAGLEKFGELYYTDKGFVKGDLAEKIALRDGLEFKTLEKLKLDELREMRYKPGDKIRLTPAEARDIMGMYQEYVRQPMFDREGEYVGYQYIECKYGDLTISGTLDRFSPEKMLIRDTKTAGRIENFERDVENTFDYITQMAFYFVLAKIHYDIDCDVRLDIVATKAPYASIIYKIDKRKLLNKMQNEIKPALTSLMNCKRTGIRPTGDRMQSLKSPYYPIMRTSIIYEPIE